MQNLDIGATIRAAVEHSLAELAPPTPIPVTESTAWFCPVSLEDWLTVADAAGVPHVGAELIAILNRFDCVSLDEPGSHQDRIVEALRNVESAATEGHMTRFDFCAPLNTKARLAEGRHQWDPDLNTLTIAEPRTFDILMDFPRERIPVWKRPWVEARIVEGYPVEYRAFVLDGIVQGISNYYPQRSLPYCPQEIDQVRAHTQSLIETLQTPFLWHNVSFPDWLDPNQTHFTADYIVDREGNVLFLEGGPPHELGAHPCCFEAYRIDGIALADRAK